ncbi:MAG TPA: hypothetical protein VEG38_10220, partial [Acidimicrobiia bacterium]|nr:hypothetical protein [Acidimicrobiia bacterium]
MNRPERLLFAPDVTVRTSVAGLTGELTSLYRRVFAEPPWNETAADTVAFRRRLAEHAAQPGFQVAIARIED